MKPNGTAGEETGKVVNTSRRKFIQLAGGVAGAGLIFASCRRTPASDTYVGEGDVALLNYLYILKQVTAAFYTQAVNTDYIGITLSEVQLQINLRDQEIVHREFFKSVLAGNAVKEITTDLSPVTFADRDNFLKHATDLEDLTVAAYNGVIQLITDNDMILTLAKMASVDGRHASYVRDIRKHNDTGSGLVINANGLNNVISPTAGMSMLDKYIETRFDITKLPTF